MSSPIPDTDDRLVAAIAAAMHLAEPAGITRPVSDNEAYLIKMERFLDAYEMILASFEETMGNSREVLDEVKARR